MFIDAKNAYQGNRAVAWVLLLYYHLLREGGVSHDQTVYVDSQEFNAFDYLAVNVALDHQSDIDQGLIRRGAVIYLLCELNDMVTDYETDYLEHPYTQKVIKALASEPAVAAVPDVYEIVQAVTNVQPPLEYPAFERMLNEVFATYVVQEFKTLLNLYAKKGEGRLLSAGQRQR